MLKSCQYCGGIHPMGTQCAKRPKKKELRDTTEADHFRWSRRWKAKREEIKARDCYMCQLCIRKLYNTVGRAVNLSNTSVHHIVPLIEDYEGRLDNANLLTLCAYHHKMAEDGDIPRGVLLQIAREQNKRGSTPLPLRVIL